jgi:hypothetical protein
MNRILKTVLLAALLVASVAHAEQRIVLHQISYHFDRSHDWNEVNPGLGYQRTTDALPGGYWQVGAYRNSVRRNTVYAIVGSEPLSVGDWRFGVFAGVATGYRENTVTERSSTKECTNPLGGNLLPLFPEPVCRTVTTEKTRTERRPGAVPMAGLTASVYAKPVSLHFVITPTIKVGSTRNHGAVALLASVPF